MDSISKTRLYSIFSGMKQRCYNPKSRSYKWYGGKGVSICPEWIGEDGVKNFIEWALDSGYEEHLSIDRIDPDGSYSPDNCRWVTMSENASRASHKSAWNSEKRNGMEIHPGLNYKFDVLEKMKERGFSTYSLNKKYGFSTGTIQKLRQWDTNVTLTTLDKICGLLRCQVDDLLLWVPHSKNQADDRAGQPNHD